MIEENDSSICRRQSAWHSDNFKCLTVNATTRQLESIPAYMNPQNVSTNEGLNDPDIPVGKGLKVKDEGLFMQHLSFPCIETSLPTMNPFPNGQPFPFPSGLDGKARTPHETSYSQQKKFLIFDRSGEETRMLLSTICSPMCNPAAISANPLPTYKFPEKVHAFKLEQSFPKVPDFFGESSENHVTDEGSDYHEDTEEINALLYSSDDDIDDDICDGEDEDEISTDHSPTGMGAGFENLEEAEEFDEEVSSSRHSYKRQKLLDGDSCSKLSLVDTEAMEKSAPQSYEDESVVNLNSTNGEPASPSVGCKRLRPDVHDKLRSIQKLIPGSKSKDPLVIIDEAITYLKSLKAKSLHMEETEGSSCHGPFL